MATNFQPVPTYQDPVLVTKDAKTGKDKSVFNPVWLSWFLQLTEGGLGSTTLHNSLGGLQGGSSGQRFHLTFSEYTHIYLRNGGAVNPITVGASPFDYINSNSYDVDILLNGGAGVGITWSRDNVTYYTVNPASMVRLSPGDRVQVTYGGIPTMVEIPR